MRHKPKLHSWTASDKRLGTLSVHAATEWFGIKVIAKIIDNQVEFKVYETYGLLDENTEGTLINQVYTAKAP